MLGLRLEAETRHFVGGGGIVKVKCSARVGSRTYDAEKKVQMAHVNNQRLSASDLRVNGRGRASQFDIDYILVLAIIILTLT
uniref:Uncharacterized protein n=1 Tax=Bracon brevicornis TaxID=1563983 RepID=A0A6V7JW28_9HYME